MTDPTEGSAAETEALVIVPTYNEIDSIGQLVGRLYEAAGAAVDLLVVDDSSPDGTADFVEELARAGGPMEIHVLRRPMKQGLGTAYLEGFRWAIERGYPAVVEMDGDLSHDPGDVPRLLGELTDADLSIGSRYIPGGTVRNWGPLRRLLSRMGNLYARWWLRLPVRDATSGFRAYRTWVLKELDLGTVSSEGYAFQVELTWRVHRMHGTISEIPIAFVERVHGHSKLSRRVVLEALVSVARWGLAWRHERRRDFGGWFARRRLPGKNLPSEVTQEAPEASPDGRDL